MSDQGRLPESVWDNPDYLEQLEQQSEEEAKMTSYENEQETS